MKTFDNPIATTRQATGNAQGFALIELLTVVGIIAILIGLLLPAIQKEREAYAAAEAEATARQLAKAANYYRNRVGEYPDSLAQLAQFVTANPAPGITIDPQLASGKKNGYLYEVGAGVVGSDHAWGIMAEPEFPGVTGSQTVTASMSFLDVLVSQFQTPGADEAREQMFNRLRAKAAGTAVKLLRLDASAISQVRQFVELQEEEGIFYFFSDKNEVSIESIRNYDDPNLDSALRDPLREFLAFVSQEMKWDSLSEEARHAIIVGTSEIEAAAGEQPPLFSYDGLSALTITTIADVIDGTSNTLLTSLLGSLEAAEAAEASGDLQGEAGALKNYQREVKAQIGNTLTRNAAKTLITLSKTL
ncbi:MAG TPA: hypothetical protein VNO70_21140 [Blastocatellia bacterium]|nr:hypothetical protein [Blastocatellia bacterium]